MYLLDQYIYPTINAAFVALINLIAPHIPIRNSSTLTGVLLRTLLLCPIAFLIK